MSDVLGIILAAGKGTRMQSDLPKVLHKACDRTLVEHVLDAARGAGVTRFVVVIGYQADQVRQALAHYDDVEFAVQSEQLGTGHAVQQCREQLESHDGPVLILAGDTPLLTSDSLASLLEQAQRTGVSCLVGSAETDKNDGLGRIVRDSGGHFLRIVEQKDASPEELAIREINTGCYVFQAADLLESLGKLKAENRQAEYYLTDCAEILQSIGKPVDAADCLSISEAMGVNTREQLEEVEQMMRSREQSPGDGE